MSIRKMFIIFTLVMMSAAALSVACSYRQNPSQFSQCELAPIQRAGVLTPVFNIVDSIPLLRRSGNGNELDLLKALTIMVGLSLLCSVERRHRATMAMFSLCVVSAVLIAHPALKEMCSRGQSQQVQTQTMNR